MDTGYIWPNLKWVAKAFGTVSKNEQKQIKLLHSTKHRVALGLFLAEGDKLIADALAAGWQPELLIATEDSRHSKVARMVTASEMKAVSALSSPSPSLAVFKKQSVSINPTTLHKKQILLLDGISDPGNAGTMLRTALWFGIETVVFSPNSVDPFSPKVVQSAMGAHFKATVVEQPLIEFIQSARAHADFSVIVADVNGQLMHHTEPLRGAGALVIGSEAHGPSAEVLQLATQRVRIDGSGLMESLNAAVAAAILMHGWSR